ncbi:MAG: hypothetical protein M3N68_11120 [Actinomycetota bacterium]|nr:hypothetical protein [Actinomycetota bacterium]
MRRLAAVAFLTGLVASLGSPIPAQATWGSVAAGTGLARAAGMPAGSAPTVAASGQDVSLTWAPRAFADKTPMEGYVVRRYGDADVHQVVGVGCAGILTATSCTEHRVPAGRWRYTVTPVFGAWTGGEGAAAGVSVATGTVMGSTLGKAEGGASGYVRRDGTYHVYASVTGDPLSVTADVSSVTATETAVPLVPGSYGAGGTTYNYRSALLRADASLTEGTSSYSVTLVAGARRAFDVVVANTAPTGAGVQTANGGTTEGAPEAGDRVSFTFSELVDASSLSAATVVSGASPSSGAEEVGGSGGDGRSRPWWGAGGRPRLLRARR